MEGEVEVKITSFADGGEKVMHGLIQRLRGNPKSRLSTVMVV